MAVTPNQVIGGLAVAYAAYTYYQQNKNITLGNDSGSAEDRKQPEANSRKIPKKNAAFVARVEAIFLASRYAEWTVQKQYLLSGDEPEDIIPKEMARLGDGSAIAIEVTDDQ